MDDAPAMTPLASFQQAFAAALRLDAPGDNAPDDNAALPARLRSQPGFAVYRNTVMKGCIDALQANFPAVVRVVGEEWFRAAAAVYAQSTLPASPTLLTYGDTFADFLAGFAPAAAMPWLSEVARIDRLWSEAHVAADDAVLAPEELLALQPDDMARTALRLHPAARWCWHDAAPLHALWSCNRDPGWRGGEFEWKGEGVLLTRPYGAVEHVPLHRAGAAFLDCCAAGSSLEAAVAAALDAQAEADLAELIGCCLRAGAFAALFTLDDTKES